MDKVKIQRCRELVAAIYGKTAQRRDEVELCELLPEILDAADPCEATIESESASAIGYAENADGLDGLDRPGCYWRGYRDGMRRRFRK